MTNKYYIDLTTNQINSGTPGSLSGSNSNFTLTNLNISLDPTLKWKMSIQTMIYENTNIGGFVFPIVLCDVTKEILNNNYYASILYKSEQVADSTDVAVRNPQNNTIIYRGLKSFDITSMNFRIVRSDTGAEFPISPASVLTMLILIEEDVGIVTL